MKTLFFTGNRPQKLPGGWNGWPKYEVKLVNFLRTLVLRAYEKGFTNFICGGALGVDQAAALAVIGARYEHVDITLAHYLPFKGFNNKWGEQSLIRFQSIDKRCDFTTYISNPPYETWKLNTRNEAMVNVSECGIAVWDGKPGGTANCLDYASRKNIPMLLVDPITFETTWQLNKQQCPGGGEIRGGEITGICHICNVWGQPHHVVKRDRFEEFLCDFCNEKLDKLKEDVCIIKKKKNTP